MQFLWVGVLLFTGSVLAEKCRQIHLGFPDPNEEGVEYDQHGPSDCELRQVVNSLKDLKSVLCKLISVQKKQIELELTRTKAQIDTKSDPILGSSKPEVSGVTDVVVGRVGPALTATETTIPSSNAVKSEPEGAIVDVKLSTSTAAPATPSSTEPPRDKRSSLHGSDFTEIHPDELAKLMGSGFNFDDDSLDEMKFISEHRTNAPGAASIVVGKADRKARNTETDAVETEEEEEQTETETEAPTKPEKPKRRERVQVKKVEVEEEKEPEPVPESTEAPQEESEEYTPPEHLTVSYDRMEKKKGSPKVSLPRQKSLEFPTGNTYYGSEQKPMDYTLNIPQQTYYFVPGPVPGQNRLVAAPQGMYDHDPEIGQNPSASLEAKYAPTSMTMEPQMHGAPMMMAPGGFGGHVQYLNEEEEEQYAPPPKEKRKRRKSRKDKKKVVEETSVEPSTEVVPPETGDF